jgi:sialate O-acetylesterase
MHILIATMQLSSDNSALTNRCYISFEDNHAMKHAFFIVLLLVGWSATLRADVKLPPVFSNHMVLQRGLALPIWGTASPGEEVTVSIADQQQITKADEQGKWRVKLAPLSLGEPLTLTVQGKNTLTMKDVLVGDVWVGSGQSNMAGGVSGYAKNDPVLAELAQQTYPKVRLLKISGTSGWQEANPANNAAASALLFSFGVHLQKELDVPVGLMLGAVGGTPSGYWLTSDMYQADAACQAQAKQAAANYNAAAAQAKYDAELAKWKVAAEAAKEKKEKVPGAPKPPVAAGELSGGKFGYLFEAHIRPVVSYGIRGVLWDQGESGTAITGVDQFHTMGALIRGWRTEWGQGDFPFLYVQKPSGQGCAWDLNDPVTKQAQPFSPLPKTVPATNDGKYRELHIKISTYPNTFMVISSDLGSGIHPTNKSGYGARAARVALGKVYDKPLEVYGPTYTSHLVEGNKLRIAFNHVGQGLSARHAEQLQGFMIASANKKFVWAEATIEGKTIVVSSPQVAKPVAVRYAWGASHPWANLFNRDGLPAQTFRTDDWE